QKAKHFENWLRLSNSTTQHRGEGYKDRRFHSALPERSFEAAEKRQYAQVSQASHPFGVFLSSVSGIDAFQAESSRRTHEWQIVWDVNDCFVVGGRGHCSR